MAAAEAAIITITATVSLNSCCRLGHTTLRSSAMVAAAKLLPGSCWGPWDSGPAAPGEVGRSGVDVGEEGVESTAGKSLAERRLPGVTAHQQTTTLPDAPPLMA